MVMTLFVASQTTCSSGTSQTTALMVMILMVASQTTSSSLIDVSTGFIIAMSW